MSEYFVVRKGAIALRNEVVWDASISYGALGILARALATPPGADLGYRAFLGRGMGEKAVRAAMRELEAAGYRHRVTVRRDGGRLRTITVFSDVALVADDVVAELPEEDRQRVVAVSSAESAAPDVPGDGVTGPEPTEQPSPEPPTREQDVSPATQDDSPTFHRAATGAARSPRTPSMRDQRPNVGDDGPSGTLTVPRSTAARSTAARSSAALSLRDTKPLRGTDKPNPTRPDPDNSPTREDRDAVGSGQVRSASESAAAAPPARSTATESQRPPDELLRLVVTCLPVWMRAMDRAGLEVVDALLRERVDAGWTPKQIRDVMDTRPPDDPIRRMSSFVAWRLRKNVAPELAPSRGAESARRSDDERIETTRRRAEAIAEPAARERDPRWNAAWERACAELPDASRFEQAQAAQVLLEAGLDVSDLVAKVRARAQRRAARASRGAVRS